MKICNCSAKLAFLALIAAGLLAVPLEIQAQQIPPKPENYAWVTNTDGSTWKREIDGYSDLKFERSDKPKIASILVPEHARIDYIDIRGCVNLTNLVLHPPHPRPRITRDLLYGGEWDRNLIIDAENSRLHNITATRTMMNSIAFIAFRGDDDQDLIHSVDILKRYALIFGWALSI